MSSRVYVDGRTSQLIACQDLVNQAISTLAAQESQVNCGHAEVVKSSIDVSAPAAAFHRARLEDRVETEDTRALEHRLSTAAPDYSAAALGDWHPVIGTETVHIEEDKVETKTNMKLLHDLECGALDGARMMIFEVEDSLGNKSYQIGLEDILFDDASGEWKSSKAKAAYESFLAKAIAAQKVALEEDRTAAGATSTKMRAAFRAAGLEATRTERLPTGATHTVFSDAPQRAAKAELKTMSAGGRDRS
jgi:hypothetical protein